LPISGGRSLKMRKKKTTKKGFGRSPWFQQINDPSSTMNQDLDRFDGWVGTAPSRGTVVRSEEPGSAHDPSSPVYDEGLGTPGRSSSSASPAPIGGFDQDEADGDDGPLGSSSSQHRRTLETVQDEADGDDGDGDPVKAGDFSDERGIDTPTWLHPADEDGDDGGGDPADEARDDLQEAASYFEEEPATRLYDPDDDDDDDRPDFPDDDSDDEESDADDDDLPARREPGSEARPGAEGEDEAAHREDIRGKNA